jgi:hypothetical protein
MLYVPVAIYQLELLCKTSINLMEHMGVVIVNSLGAHFEQKKVATSMCFHMTATHLKGHQGHQNHALSMQNELSKIMLW